MKNKGQIKSNNLSKYRDEIITFSGITVKKKGKPKKNAKIDPLSKLSRKEKRKLERKLKHAKNLAFHKKIEMPKLENLVERKKKRTTTTTKSKGDHQDEEEGEDDEDVKIKRKKENDENKAAEKLKREKEAEKVRSKNRRFQSNLITLFVFIETTSRANQI